MYRLKNLKFLHVSLTPKNNQKDKKTTAYNFMSLMF